MRMTSTHAVAAMSFKNEGTLCPELKIATMQTKPLLLESVYLQEMRDKRRKKRLFDMSMKYKFILTGLNVRVTRAEYMGEDYGGKS